ncbi:MAG TPA: sigma-54 dependent transcriptional regulator [Clostridia bacterium]|nr:sigma-54 dependent transcriptional regulator [Clostridia bacterium]
MTTDANRQVLVVDDEAPMRTALQASFRRHGWRAETASGVAEARAQLDRASFGLVVTDVRMSDGSGLEVMRHVRNNSPSTAVIVLTAFGNVPGAVAAMRDGACDYLVKPISFEQLQAAVERVMARAGAQPQVIQPSSAQSEFPCIIGHSPALLRALERARQAASTDADVLIEAESGTGKELLARLIHEASPRRGQPFVAVNCAALPEPLLESELFGHVRGAFTGALATKPGKFELANGGTLLLDEVGEMPLSLQPKLLRVLQEREVERLGDTRPVKVDIRVIATTNRSLDELVRNGEFRADLYYRLNVIPLSLPPLRERREDIGELAEFFARKYAGEKHMQLSHDFVRGLQEHPWTGNVRELANFIRRVTALCSGNEIGSEFLEFGRQAEKRVAALEPGVSLRDLERKLLEVTLAATEGNRTRAAEMLGVSLRTVRNKIRDYGLPPRRFA